MKRRKISVLTTSRADYGLLYWLIEGIRRDKALSLQLIVTGSHLSKAFGYTLGQIRKDGFRPAALVPLLPKDDSGLAAATALARGTEGFAKAFARLKPDILVMLGDRLELLSAASAAVALRVPIAHIHGGESSEGVLDEQVRHAVSKLSHLHFTAAQPYRRRLLQMGEDPRRVFNVGAPGLEYIRKTNFLGRAELERRIGLPLSSPLALVTLHPGTLAQNGKPDRTLESLLGAVDRADLRAVFTYANADAGGRSLNKRIESYVARRKDRAAAVASLGQQGYLSLMRLCDVVVGNSSSGIIETPALKRPTVNIGGRQDGRLRAPSVIDCPGTPAAIAKALARALSPGFRRTRCTGKSPYGAGGVASRIIRVLKSTPLGSGLLRKSFHER